MAEVMNRAARRAEKVGNTGSKNGIETAVYVVPMDLVEGYYHTQIAREGLWNDDPPVIVTRPVTEIFRADDEWFDHTLSQMREVRRPGTNRYVFPGEAGKSDTDIDIGLIDVQVYFNHYTGDRRGSPKTNENFQIAERLCGSNLTTQNVLATAVHQHRPNGDYVLHYHNLIFALRKQVDPDEHIGIVDLLPLVKALASCPTFNLILDV
jgi:hypothetical protein